MAAAVVAIVVDDLVRKLSQGMVLGPQWRVEAHLRKIQDHLSSVEEALPMAERKHGRSLELQEFVRKLKDAAYDMEDLLEELSMEKPMRLRDGKLRRLFRGIEWFCFGWKMSRAVYAILGRLPDLTDPLISIMCSIPAEVQEVPEALEIPFVGRDNERRELICFLLDRDWEEDSVLVVDGAKGIGKTALVQEVMPDLEAGGYFNVKIWVNASPLMDINRIAKEIIAGLREEEEEEDEEEGELFGWEQSLHLLARLLNDSKRYLLVLDNINVSAMDSERWLSIWSLLAQRGATGSKILVTFSQDWVWTSFYLGSHIPRVRIEGMVWEDALKLLWKTASLGRRGRSHIIHNPQILKMAEDIVDLCEGRPRMIKALGSYLSLQPPAVEDWSRLLVRLHNRLSSDFVFSRSFPEGYEYGDLTRVKSYNNLPPRIKQCFALCSLFPSGHPINPHTLAELWISLGFINQEDIADHYVDELLQVKLFRVMKTDISGKVISVTLHPDVQEFAHSIAGWECLALGIYIPVTEYYMRQYARHLSIINYQGDTCSGFLGSKLRTFLHFEEDHGQLKEMYHDIIANLNRVRVLDLHDVKVDVFPKVVWKLKHLRYLDLSGNSTLKMLPRAITRLLNLQTLKLSGCSSLKELPRDLNNLSALRHLYIDGCWKLSLIPRGLSDLKCLNILTDFILPPDDSSKTADSVDLTDLCRLNNLRGSLKIRNLGCYKDELVDEGLEGLLNNKCYLESVELRFMNLPTDARLLEKLQPHPKLKELRFHNYGGFKFPEWMSELSTHLPNLVEIALIGCENCMHLPPFGHQPHLKKLTIQGLPDLEHMESGSGQSLPEDVNDPQLFGNLFALCIKDCPKLNFLPIIPHLMKLTLVNVGELLFRHPCQFPNLKTLRLESIEFHDHLPEEWLRALTNLKELHIVSCPSLGSLSRGISHLEKLETLSIWNCKALDLSKNEQGTMVTELPGLKSLRCLTIYKASKMEHLPEWLSRVATLRTLCIRSCPSLVVLPEWIGSLQSLELIHCPGLASFPEGIHDFTSSYPKKLTVVGCPALESQLRGKEAEKDGHVADEWRNSEEKEIERVRKKRVGASRIL